MTKAGCASSESPSPKSDAALDHFPEFTGRVRERLENGKRVYGDDSFDRPLINIVEEIRQEVLDVCGWSFILYQRLAELEALLEQKGND